MQQTGNRLVLFLDNMETVQVPATGALKVSSASPSRFPLAVLMRLPPGPDTVSTASSG